LKLIRSIALLSLFAATPLFAQQAKETWTVDKVHSSVTFKVRHFVANTTGTFRTFDGTIELDRANLAGSSVEFTIDAASIDTDNENRDKHLRSADFFDVVNHPKITFKSSSIAQKSANEFDVTGDFTMRGVTKRITLPVTFLGFAKTARGEKSGVEIETTINRKDYGVAYNRALEEGGLMLGEDVKIAINLELDRKPAAAPAK
jgi:polyisoprenoid-binding protein YceI